MGAEGALDQGSGLWPTISGLCTWLLVTGPHPGSAGSPGVGNPGSSGDSEEAEVTLAEGSARHMRL